MEHTGPYFNSSEFISYSETNWIKLREKFVQNLNGTSLDEMLLLAPLPSLVTFISVYLKLILLSKLNMNTKHAKIDKSTYRILIFLYEFITLIVPGIILQFTILVDYYAPVLACTAIFSFFLVVSSVSNVNNDVLYWRIPHFKNKLYTLDDPTEKQVLVTYFRSITYLVTSFSILAVDFQVFPRRFAKTENYGLSLMDLGVGMYIMSSAIVVKENVETRKLRESFSEFLSLLAVGVVRSILMQQIRYQKHVSEYGIHWNFFITLAFVKLLSSVILKMFRGRSLICGLILLSLHQFLLSFAFEEILMSHFSRDNWITANLEGIVSLPGYLSLYLIGIATMRFARRAGKDPKQCTIITKLNTFTFLVILFIALLPPFKWLITIFKVSRRLVNCFYVLFVLMACIAQITTGLAFELVATCFSPLISHDKLKIYEKLVPDIFTSVNKNPLLFFLVSNLITGAVNLSVDVLNLDSSKSLAVLTSYMFVNCAVVHIFHLYDIQLKFR